MIPVKKQKTQDGVTYAKLQVTTLRLNHSCGSPSNETLNQSIRNHLISTSEVICLTDP